MTEKSPEPDNVHGRAAALITKYMTPKYLRPVISAALEEDLGPGDLTTCIFPAGAKGAAVLTAKADGVLSGTEIVDAVFKTLNRNVNIQWDFHDGDTIAKGARIATLTGPITSLLQGERVALNFLQRMSGIATLTRKYVEIVSAVKNGPDIFDTRKTTPLLRVFEKKAVLDGGGRSHRFALYDMAMLKDNHIDAAGGISQAVDKLADNGFFKKKPRPGLCIEVRTIEEMIEAMRSKADIIMLDNMAPATIKKAVERLEKEARDLRIAKPELEISGGITLKNLKSYATLPVQRISVGALTHSAPALDISMIYEKPPG